MQYLPKSKKKYSMVIYRNIYVQMRLIMFILTI